MRQSRARDVVVCYEQQHSAPPLWAGRWPGRSGAAGSAASRGAKLRAAGIARRAFPWRQAKRAAPQARRREGLKPNGRDSEVGTGRSPKARRRFAPTRPSHSEHHAERLVERFNTTHSFMRLPYVRPRRLRVPTHEYERAAPCNTQVLGVLGPSAKRSPRNGRGRPATHEDP